jgi:hypothetical protein
MKYRCNKSIYKMKKKNQSLTYTIPNRNMKINKLGIPNRKPLASHGGMVKQPLYTRCLRCNTPRRICEIKKSASCTVIQKNAM